MRRRKRSPDGDYLALAMIIAMTCYAIGERFLSEYEPQKPAKAPLTRFVCGARAGDMLRLRDGRMAAVTRRESELVFYRFSPQEREEVGSCKLIAWETLRVDFQRPGFR